MKMLHRHFMRGVITMKKTIRTVLTAAMFASANLAAIPGNAAGETNPQIEKPSKNEALTELADTRKPMPNYGSPEKMKNLTTMEELVTTTTTSTELIYGPPWMFTTVTTQPVPQPDYGAPWLYDETSTTVTTSIPQLLYGAPIFNSMFAGDINLDKQIDNFDAIALRRMLLTGKAESFEGKNYADINRDGKVGISDLLMLQKFLLGKVKTLYNGTPTMEWARDVSIEAIGNTTIAPSGNKTTTTTTYDPRNDIIVTLYGIAPIRDVMTDIHGDIKTGVDNVAENNTPSQEK